MLEKIWEAKATRLRHGLWFFYGPTQPEDRQEKRTQGESCLASFPTDQWIAAGKVSTRECLHVLANEMPLSARRDVQFRCFANAQR